MQNCQHSGEKISEFWNSILCIIRAIAVLNAVLPKCPSMDTIERGFGTVVDKIVSIAKITIGNLNDSLCCESLTTATDDYTKTISECLVDLVTVLEKICRYYDNHSIFGDNPFGRDYGLQRLAHLMGKTTDLSDSIDLSPYENLIAFFKHMPATTHNVELLTDLQTCKIIELNGMLKAIGKALRSDVTPELTLNTDDLLPEGPTSF